MSRVVVITGASGGVGRALATTFAGAGDEVVAVGRDRASLETTAATLCCVCDVTNEQAVVGTFERLDRIDVLVNNAGASTSAPLTRSALADWQLQIDTNATGAFLCTRAALPGMLERHSGRIITVASTAGVAGSPYTVGYTASKHAAVGLMRATAAEVVGTGVTANAVCPAFVRTPMTHRSIERIAKATGRSNDAAEAALIELTPLGRLLEPEEVAFAVAMLAAPEASAINGQTLVLDGGGINK